MYSSILNWIILEERNTNKDNTFFAPEKIDDLFNLTFPPTISGERSRSIDVDGDDGSFFWDSGGGGGAIDFGNDDFVFPFNLSPPKNVTALAVLTTEREIDIDNWFWIVSGRISFFSSLTKRVGWWRTGLVGNTLTGLIGFLIFSEFSFDCWVFVRLNKANRLLKSNGWQSTVSDDDIDGNKRFGRWWLDPFNELSSTITHNGLGSCEIEFRFGRNNFFSFVIPWLLIRRFSLCICSFEGFVVSAGGVWEITTSGYDVGTGNDIVGAGNIDADIIVRRCR